MQLRVLLLLLLVALILLLLVAMAPAWGQQGRTIECQAGTVCLGTSGNDTIIGSPGNDNIRPQDGDDKVYANGGDDQVGHSGGKDYIEGGDGVDTLRGGFGLDTIYGNKRLSKGADTPDGDHDLIDCAYLTTRGDPGGDVGYGEPTDTVVDCSNRDDQ